MPDVASIYTILLREYGPQGWWPVLKWESSHPDKTGSTTGYHVGRYDFPRNRQEQFEICIGAILTQNTAWTNVEMALRNLASDEALSPTGIAALPEDRLKTAIRPSGHFNLKARKLREFASFYRALGGRVPNRDDLLAVWGVGPETADSIRLYAYGQTEMVVDAYTRRILAHLNLADPDWTYDQLKACCRSGLPEDVVVYQEFHALIVEHAKRFYRRQPYLDLLLCGNGRLDVL